MKNRIITFIVAGSAILAACSDVKDLDAGYVDKFSNDGPPQISAVYDLQDTELLTPITEGVLNQYIHIKGSNLAEATSININGLEVDIPTRVYAESSDCYIRIPRAIPENETGKLVYKTELGTATFDFYVGIPSLELIGLQNEFAWQGSRVQLSGDYFDLYGFNDTTATSPVSIIISNAYTGYREEIKCDSCTEAYTSITIPKDCPDCSVITFEWNAMGGARASKTIAYRMTDQLLFGDFSGDLGWWNDMGKDWLKASSEDGAPAGLGYPYLRLNGTFAAWDWDLTGMGCNWPHSFTLDEIDDYVFKFEVNTNASTPFLNYGTNGKDGDKNGGYRMTFANAPNRGQFDPVSDGLTNTNGKWITVRMPLSELMDGLEAAPEKDTWVSFEFGTQPNTEEDWTIDHSFGQFRIEPAEY